MNGPISRAAVQIVNTVIAIALIAVAIGLLIGMFFLEHYRWGCH